MSTINDKQKNRTGHSVKVFRDYVFILLGAFVIVNNVHEVLGEGFRPRI